MRLSAIILLILFLLSGIGYYILTQPPTQERQVQVTRVIDGDTIELKTGERVRLKGINTPERGMNGYGEAKKFLQEKIENKTITLHSSEKDKYQRTLGHIIFKENNINEALLREGHATLYYYEKDQYYSNLKTAEQSARKDQLGLWRPSPHKDCITLQEFEYIEPTKRCNNEEIVTLHNSCNQKLDITLKDDATHITKATIQPFQTVTKNFSCTFNNAGDSLYVWDKNGLLLFHRYK